MLGRKTTVAGGRHLSDPRIDDLIEQIADTVRTRGLAVPALLLGEACRPLGFFAAQWLHAFGPLMATITCLVRPGLDEAYLARVACLLEDRQNLDRLLSRLEQEAGR